MDTVPAPFDVVADIRDAVGNELEIVMDGGIRRGSDIVKAIARGANACSVGRPYLHALAAGGEGGVTSMFEILRSELERSMALMGLARIGDIESSILRRQ